MNTFKSMNTSKFFSVLFSTLMLAGFVACDKNPADKPGDKPGEQPTEQPGNNEEIVDEFSRMMLLEQFTSERCVNCPGGVIQIDEYLRSHKNIIWLSHHAGYGDDQWTISGSKAIANLLNVSGAPSIALDRTLLTAKENKDERSGYNLHPYYLEYLTNSFTTTTTASVRISNTIDGDSLHISVAGSLKKDAPKNMRLTVAIKENGLHGKQQDPYGTLAGIWDDYVHSNVIRTFVSEVGGDAVTPSDNAYELNYSIAIDPAWEAKNCLVVAFLTDENSLNIVQAAEKPVVAGTNGGSDLPHGGVTPKPVPDGYPEGKYAISDMIKSDTVTFQHAQTTFNKLPNGLREWHILAWTTAQSYGSGQNLHIPFADIVFFTEGTVNAVPQSGDWDFVVARSVDEIRVSTAWAGYCDIEAQQITGSELQLVNKAYFEAGQIIPGSNGRWLIANGQIHFSSNGFSVTATSASGKAINLRFSGTYNR